MKKSFDQYEYLAGGRATAGTLWIAPDHLLCIETAGFIIPFTESYRRVDFKNIQSISIARTSRRAWVMEFAFLALSLAAYLVYYGIVDATDSAAVVIAALIGVPALAILVVQMIRGPSAVMKIQTAVQFLKVKAVNTESTAKKVSAKLTSLCLHHQQGLTPMTQDRQHVTAPVDLSGIKERYSTGLWLPLGLLITLLAGVGWAAEGFTPSSIVLGCNLGLTSVALVTSLIALARSAAFETKPGLKPAIWMILINSFVTGVAVYGIFIYSSLRSMAADSITDPLAANAVTLSAFHHMAQIGVEEASWVVWMLVVLGGIYVTAAILGLPGAFAATKEKSIRRAQPSAPPVAPPPINPPPPPMLP